MPYLPAIRNVRAKRIQAIYLSGIMRNGRTIGNNRHRKTDPLKAVPYPRRHRHQTIVVRPEKYFLELPTGRAVLAVVVEHEFYVSVGNGVVQRHPLVEVPRLNGPRIDTGKVNFTEPRKAVGISSQHMHDLSPLVQELFQLGYFDAVNHHRTPHSLRSASWSYPGRSRRNRPPCTIAPFPRPCDENPIADTSPGNDVPSHMPDGAAVSRAACPLGYRPESPQYPKTR